MSELERLALGCLFPGFEGLEAPEWILRRLAAGLGGVVLYARNVESREQLAALTEQLRAERADVLVAIDEEGGDVTRLEATTGSSYPGNAALGAVDDVALTEEVASALGTDLRAVGVNLDFAPVADVNSNPANPIIGIRSFGADPELVARHVAAFVRGLQSSGVAGCAKHFPGHGDTDADSHLELPAIHADRETLFARELVPFRAAISAGVQALMTAHILVPALDETPATASRVFLQELLRRELAFDGMVMTDALEMRAISATVGVEDGAVAAISAGADALCFGHDLADASVESVTAVLVAAVGSGRLAEERLAEAFDRVRCVSEWTTDTGAMASVTAPGVGLEAARRAVVSDGPVVLSRPAFIVELTVEPSIAAGPSPGAGEWLHRALPDSVLQRKSAASGLEDVESSDPHQFVLVVHDVHRHPREREAVESLVAAHPDAVVVEVGIPEWRPNGRTGYIASYGAGRVNLEAAAERLSGGRAILPAATRGGAVR